MSSAGSASERHSPAPWKLTVAGTTWGLSAKGAKPRDGEPDIAQGSTFAERWRDDVALLRAAPKMLDALRVAEAALPPGEARQIVARAIKAATTPAS